MESGFTQIRFVFDISLAVVRRRMHMHLTAVRPSARYRAACSRFIQIQGGFNQKSMTMKLDGGGGSKKEQSDDHSSLLVGGASYSSSLQKAAISLLVQLLQLR